MNKTPLISYFHLLPDICREWVDSRFMDNPFSTEPSTLATFAANQLQEKLSSTFQGHDFGLTGTGGLGKMLGVLVGYNQERKLGYLAAFSGKLDCGTNVPGFVPPVFDTFEEGGLYKTEEEIINQVNQDIATIEKSTAYVECIQKWQTLQSDWEEKKEALHSLHKEAKLRRKQVRNQLLLDGKTDNDPDILALNRESARHHFEWKDFLKNQKQSLAIEEAKVSAFQEKMENLKGKRKQLSARLQDLLFDQYSFLNAQGNTKSLRQIFQPEHKELIPSGAGECTAPKLLHFAFSHRITPLAMAEFWWGKSPSSEIRVHRHFYPACRSKCHPILQHMLEGLSIRPLPDHQNPDLNQELPVLFEDDVIIIVNKPAQFLSVPGKTIRDSVLTRWQNKYKNATGPLIVHRLDMSTSGIILGAKTKEAHAFLQKQFENRTIKKRYVAILAGKPKDVQGQIDLPLRVDIDDRPRQLVCFDHGKPSTTYWKLIHSDENESRVHFFPVTGRTHQLRVHAAHNLGLGIPIKGDDLYGQPSDRLYLHAEQLELLHPMTGKKVIITCPAPF